MNEINNEKVVMLFFKKLWADHHGALGVLAGFVIVGFYVWIV